MMIPLIAAALLALGVFGTYITHTIRLVGAAAVETENLRQALKDNAALAQYQKDVASEIQEDIVQAHNSLSQAKNQIGRQRVLIDALKRKLSKRPKVDCQVDCVVPPISTFTEGESYEAPSNHPPDTQ